MQKKAEKPFTSREEEETKKAWKSYTGRQKASYIWSYYHRYIIIGLIVIVAVIYMVISPGRNTSPAELDISVMGGTLTEDETRELKASLAELLSVDPSSVEISCYTTTDASGENVVSAVTYMRSGRVDLLFAPDETFNTYAAAGYLEDLAKVDGGSMVEGKTDDELFFAVLSQYSAGPVDASDITYAPHVREGSSGCYGVRTDADGMQNWWMGILVNSPHQENAKKAAAYLVQKG